MRVVRAVILLACAVSATSPAAGAQLSLGVDVAYFSWHEAPRLQESGGLVGFDVRYLQPRHADQLLLAYRGRVYVGVTGYSGSYLFAPDISVNSIVGYFGMTQEGQLRYRTGAPLDVVAALGGEFWRRQMSSEQGEDYRVVYAALGVELNPLGQGATGSIRLSFPLWTQLDAHLMRMGFDQNPVITPGKDLGGSLSIGYRNARGRSIIGYLKFTRFTTSNWRDISWGNGNGSAAIGQPETITFLVGVELLYAH